MRFKDDCCLVPNDTPAFYKCIAEIQKRSGYFIMNVEEINSYQLHFLELNVHKHNGCLAVKYQMKDNFGFPLSCRSGHHPSVHKSWPISFVKRIIRLSPSIAQARTSITEMEDRLRASTTPFIWPSQYIIDCMLKGEVNKDRTTASSLWLPISYHPTLRRPIMHALAKFTSTFEAETKEFLRLDGRGNDTIKVCWKNAAPSLETRCRNLFNMIPPPIDA